MDLNKFTEKTREALSEAQAIAVRRGHQAADEPHMLIALLEQDGGLARRIVERMSLDARAMVAGVERLLDSVPSVSGPGVNPGSITLTRELSQALVAASDEAGKMDDEYVSVEHVLLGFLSRPGKSGQFQQLLSTFNVTRDRLLTAIREIRGNQRVTSANPEAAYEALAKYGRDLVAAAREGRLDPVIGRDDEIRRVVRILARRTKNNPVLIG
ncbi:MAG: type VI secretion system ATPase TssH, partial [Myxococcales bacterium]|nr:type VI secretion system ATPase TssH [Myxococcales bacterium]